MAIRPQVLIGKTIKYAAALRGGGSALPGLVVEKIDPTFIPRTLGTLPYGVVVISGTNGKTTTTKIVVELLESHGLKVFTNRTGSNFTRGVAAALLGEVDAHGRLDKDIAVLELDEAHAVHFVRSVKPRYSLLLNVMRDQLDRFGEIDATAKLLQLTAEATAEKVVINREDPRLVTIGKSVKSPVYFGLSDSLLAEFPSDDELRASNDAPRNSDRPVGTVILETIQDHTATFTIGKESVSLSLKLEGTYNIFNAGAAIALVREILGDTLDSVKMYRAVEGVAPAFGRGESLTVYGQPLELVLVKNPAGFRLSLSSFSPKNYATMIAINDNYADGRDMSWLWDVDFDSLREEGVAAITGVRAYEMALRLQYEEVPVSHVDTAIVPSLRHFIDQHKTQPKRIYCTYTAMLKIRKELAKLTNVETIS